MITVGMLVLLLIDASVQLDGYHSFSALTQEEKVYVDRNENPDDYALCQ
jgi:hypothetical protein